MIAGLRPLFYLSIADKIIKTASSVQKMQNHIPKEVVQKYRESLRSEFASRQFHLEHPDFCEKTMGYFEKMGEFAENAATKDDISEVKDIVTQCNIRALEQVDKVSAKVDAQGRDIESLKHNDRRQDSRLDKLEHQNLNMSIKMDHVETYTRQIPQLFDSINTLHDTVNLALSKASAQPKTAQKQSMLSKIPLAAWLALAGALASAIVYIVTGEIVTFGGAK